MHEITLTDDLKQRSTLLSNLQNIHLIAMTPWEREQ